jgi:tRNA threonylcarbamoyl adenosine modification protein YeaZ
MQLALDTSTGMASVALVDGDSLISEVTWRCGQNHSVELLPRVLYILQSSKFSLQSVDAVFVAKGPGSYNGLRVGISTAKGLALGLEIPVIGIGTLEIAAYQYAETKLPVCSILRAGREKIAYAVYQCVDGKWQQRIPERLATINELCLQITTDTIFCGEYIPNIAIELERILNQRVIIPMDVNQVRKASYLAKLGQQQLELGNIDDHATLQPLYLGNPVITERKHR